MHCTARLLYIPDAGSSFWAYVTCTATGHWSAAYRCTKQSLEGKTVIKVKKWKNINCIIIWIFLNKLYFIFHMESDPGSSRLWQSWWLPSSHIGVSISGDFKYVIVMFSSILMWFLCLSDHVFTAYLLSLPSFQLSLLSISNRCYFGTYAPLLNSFTSTSVSIPQGETKTVCDASWPAYVPYNKLVRKVNNGFL